MIFLVYASLVFLVLRFSVTLFNFLSNPKLGHYGKHFNDRVSVIFFSTGVEELDNEALNALRDQDYTNLEILIKMPGQGLNETLAAVSGKYLLFIKEAALLQKGFINSLLYRMKLYDLALISVLPNRRFEGWKSYCMHPLKDLVLMSIFPMRLLRVFNIPAFSTASQPCMFFDSETYKINRKGRQSGKTKMELLQANKFVYVTERDPLAELGSNLMKTLDNNYLVAFIYVVLSLVGPIVMAVNFEPAFLLLPFGLIFLMRIMISFLSGQNPFINVLLHPVQMMALVAAILTSLKKAKPSVLPKHS